MHVSIFFCYAHEDEALLNKLKSHLRPLQREGLIDVWYDRDITAGTVWEDEIKARLNTAQIILLLVSSDFMNSDYCYGIMKRALERHERGEAKVIPIILRYVHWQEGVLGKLLALPTDGIPIIGPDRHNLDRDLYDVTTEINKVIAQLSSHPAPALSIVSEEIQPKVAKDSNPAGAQQESNVLPVISPLINGKLTLLHTFTGHKITVWGVAISSDGQMLVSGSADGMIKVWELSIGKEVRTIKEGYTITITSIVISPDDRTLVSGSADGMIKVWSAHSVSKE